MPPRRIGPVSGNDLRPMLSHFNSLLPGARLLTTEVSDPERLTQGLLAKSPPDNDLRLLRHHTAAARQSGTALAAITLHALHRDPSRLPSLLFLYRYSTAASTHHSGVLSSLSPDRPPLSCAFPVKTTTRTRSLPTRMKRPLVFSPLPLPTIPHLSYRGHVFALPYFPASEHNGLSTINVFATTRHLRYLIYYSARTSGSV
jgi:hypothetical protein